MQEKEIQKLLNRYREGKCTAEERAFLESWYAQWNKELPLDLSELDLATDLLVIKENVLPIKRSVRVVRLWPRIAVAASIAFTMALGLWFFATRIGAPHDANEIGPGKHTAILTLSDGKTIVLSDAKKGIVIDASSLRYDDGSEVFRHTLDSAYAPESGELRTLVVATPRGGTYQVTLPDGTKVWLNADSELTYPEVFGTQKREVRLRGEAYFEVTKSGEGAAFVVRTPQMDVKVLGTKFNVNAYADEAFTKTTLVEGSVVIQTADGRSSVIKPGQQAYQTINGIQVDQVDAHTFVAWKDGYFAFSNANLKEIARQVARWYAISVDYTSIPDLHFTGGISRDVPLRQVIDMLEKSGKINFVFEDNQLMVR